jgi:tetratricopeptide (TPR) repeat protein
LPARLTPAFVDDPEADKALELLYRAERLSPREPRGWLIAMGIANVHIQAGRFDEGISACRRALNQNPRNAMMLRMLAASLVKQGRQSEASQVAREVLAVEPQLTLTKLRARFMFVNAEFWKNIRRHCASPEYRNSTPRGLGAREKLQPDPVERRKCAFEHDAHSSPIGRATSPLRPYGPCVAWAS